MEVSSVRDQQWALDGGHGPLDGACTTEEVTEEVIGELMEEETEEGFLDPLRVCLLLSVTDVSSFVLLREGD